MADIWVLGVDGKGLTEGLDWLAHTLGAKACAGGGWRGWKGLAREGQTGL